MEKEPRRHRQSRRCSVCRLPVKGHPGPCGPGKCQYERGKGASDSDAYFSRLKDTVRHLRKESKVDEIARRVWSESTSDESEDVLTPRPRSLPVKTADLSPRRVDGNQARHARAYSEPPEVPRLKSAFTSGQESPATSKTSKKESDSEQYTVRDLRALKKLVREVDQVLEGARLLRNEETTAPAPHRHVAVTVALAVKKIGRTEHARLVRGALGNVDGTGSGATAETSGIESGVTAEASGTESGATAEKSGTESGATAEKSGTENGATAEKSGTESGATTEKRDTENGATTEEGRELLHRVNGEKGVARIGPVRTVRRPSRVQETGVKRKDKLCHLSDLMFDAVYHDWVTVRELHAAVLYGLEHETVTWSDSDMLDTIRDRHYRTQGGVATGSAQGAEPRTALAWCTATPRSHIPETAAPTTKHPFVPLRQELVEEPPSLPPYRAVRAAHPDKAIELHRVVSACEAMVKRVPQFRLEEVRLLLDAWIDKKKALKRELQSLIGKLVFVSACVAPGRLFISRMLEVLRSVRRSHHRIRLSRDFKLDVRWWRRFMTLFNGVSLLTPDICCAPDEVVATDACLTGCGGICNGEFFHSRFPTAVLEQYGAKIHVLEMLTIVVAARKWGPGWRGSRIVINCDNMACVYVLNSGRSRDKDLLHSARELWLIAASCDFVLRAEHIQGRENRVADHLSRWHLSSKHAEQFHILTEDVDTIEIPICQRYDILVIQEVRDSTGTAIVDLLNRVNRTSFTASGVTTSAFGRGTLEGGHQQAEELYLQTLQRTQGVDSEEQELHAQEVASDVFSPNLDQVSFKKFTSR
ncbi:hypothetical protein Bbelb_070700 [Branchiostoma belcheri]|nr:hypothetical protein Bbelb_070700 [Branchiostoma belcheri]